jgi:cephalosporin hydroxylase
MEIFDIYIEQLRNLGKIRDNDLPKMRYFLKEVCNHYLGMFFFAKPWILNKYKGITTYKFPTDLWIIQEIVMETKPDLIIETGTMNGGTTLFYADLLDYLGGDGMVVSVDINMNGNMPQHKRIKYIKGDSTCEDVVKQVYEEVKEDRGVMVDLDSNHYKDHVLKELNLYSKFVTVGNYLIVEDTIIGGHPVDVYENDGETLISQGPYEAVMEFFKTNKNNNNFVIDKSKERFNLTTNINGFLKRIS